MFSVKRIDARHGGERRDARARDRRMWKQWRCGKLDNMIVQVVRTRKEKPTPAEVVKTEATQLGDVIPCMTAEQAIYSESWEQKYMQRKNFELIIPYIEALKKANTGLVIGFSRDFDKCLRNIHVFHGFMNESLSICASRRCVAGCWALEGCAQRSPLCCLSEANDVYSIGFMISKGNEGGNTWTRRLTLLKEACPILSSQGFPDAGVAGVEFHRAYLED